MTYRNPFLLLCNYSIHKYRTPYAFYRLPYFPSFLKISMKKGTAFGYPFPHIFIFFYFIIITYISVTNVTTSYFQAFFFKNLSCTFFTLSSVFPPPIHAATCAQGKPLIYLRVKICLVRLSSTLLI